MTNTRVDVYVRGGCIDEIQGNLLVATFYHTDRKRALAMADRFILDDNQGNFHDWLTVDDYFIEVDDFEIEEESTLDFCPDCGAFCENHICKKCGITWEEVI